MGRRRRDGGDGRPRLRGGGVYVYAGSFPPPFGGGGGGQAPPERRGDLCSCGFLPASIGERWQGACQSGRETIRLGATGDVRQPSRTTRGRCPTRPGDRLDGSKTGRHRRESAGGRAALFV